MKKNPNVPTSLIRQKAKKIKKEKSIPYLQALNEAAKDFGHSNFQNHKNVKEEKRIEHLALKANAEHQLWEDKAKEASKRLKPVLSEIKSFSMSFQVLLGISTDLQLAKKGLQKKLKSNALLKKFIELHLLKDALEDEDGVIDDYEQHHIPAQLDVKNLNFKVKNNILKVEGEYDLALEFAHDYDKVDTSEFFQNRTMGGWFDLRITQEKEVKIEINDIWTEL